MAHSQKYQQYNAEVVDKGDLIQDAVDNVGRMFRRKIEAVRVSSRAAADEATYCTKWLEFERQ